MDFKDWRKSSDKSPTTDPEPSPARRYYGKYFEDYISEQIRRAEAEGKFDNLQGAGKPLNLDSNAFVGDKAMGYNLLKSNGFAPQEIELAKEIRVEYEHLEAKIAKVRHQGHSLRTRRVPPFPSERRAYNALVEKTATEYDKALRDLNHKILTLNLMVPPVMHQPMFQVEQLVREFREGCPLFKW